MHFPCPRRRFYPAKIQWTGTWRAAHAIGMQNIADSDRKTASKTTRLDRKLRQTRRDRAQGPACFRNSVMPHCCAAGNCRFFRRTMQRAQRYSYYHQRYLPCRWYRECTPGHTGCISWINSPPYDKTFIYIYTYIYSYDYGHGRPIEWIQQGSSMVLFAVEYALGNGRWVQRTR